MKLFLTDIQNHLSEEYDQNPDSTFSTFKRSIYNILELHATLKKRYVRANQGSFINKKISKEIMKRSRLRNKFLKSKSDINRKAYNKQRNYCVSLIRREKKEFLAN